MTARVLNPSGAKTDTYVTDNGDGTYRVQYTAYEEGEELGWVGLGHLITAFSGWLGVRVAHAHPDPLCVAGLQACILWRCCMMR